MLAPTCPSWVPLPRGRGAVPADEPGELGSAFVPQSAPWRDRGLFCVSRVHTSPVSTPERRRVLVLSVWKQEASWL